MDREDLSTADGALPPFEPGFFRGSSPPQAAPPDAASPPSPAPGAPSGTPAAADAPPVAPTRSEATPDPAAALTPAPEPPAETPPAETPPTEATDWQRRLDESEAARKAAEERIAAFERSAQELLLRGQQQQQEAERREIQQAWNLYQQQIRDGVLSQETIEQANAEWAAYWQTQVAQANQTATQVFQTHAVNEWKGALVQHYGLTEAEARELVRYNFDADPNRYEQRAQEIVAHRETVSAAEKAAAAKYAQMEQRVAQLEREDVAQQQIASGAHNPGGSGAAGPIPLTDPRFDPESDQYDWAADLRQNAAPEIFGSRRRSA